MLRKVVAVSACVAILPTQKCWASCPDDISYSTSGSGTHGSFTCSSAPEGLYDIEIVATSSGTFTYTIDIDNSLSIRNLKVKNEGGSNTAVEVTLTTIGRVENVLKQQGSNGGEVWIGTIAAISGIGDGSDGSIDVNKIEELFTLGDLTAMVNLSGSTIVGESVGLISCGGDLLGDLLIQGDVDTIAIAGDYGV